MHLNLYHGIRFFGKRLYLLKLGRECTVTVVNLACARGTLIAERVHKCRNRAHTLYAMEIIFIIINITRNMGYMQNLALNFCSRSSTSYVVPFAHTKFIFFCSTHHSYHSGICSQMNALHFQFIHSNVVYVVSNTYYSHLYCLFLGTPSIIINYFVFNALFYKAL